ncbi:MAG: hypothetical protein ACRCZS_19820 [Chroococcidiopsis sp.]
MRSHAHQISYISDRLTFKTVATRLAIAILQDTLLRYRNLREVRSPVAWFEGTTTNK